MSILNYLLRYICLFLFCSATIFAQELNNSNSPILMIPSAILSQGLDNNIQNILRRNYHTNFPDKFPEDLQFYLINLTNKITFLNNSNLRPIVPAISYDDIPSSKVLTDIRNSVARQVKTVIITKIDSEGSEKIEFKAKALNLLNNSIVIEKNIVFPSNQISNVDEKIQQLAKKMLFKRPIYKKPVFWTAIFTVVSATYWGIENSKINDRQLDYDSANTIGSVQIARKRAEDQVERRNYAIGITVGFATITTILKLL